MIKNRNTTVLASEYQHTDDMKKFIKKTTGAIMTPVQGKDDTFWLHGDKRGNYYQKKYYKIEFGFVEQVSYRPNREVREGYGFDIQSPGDLNGWQLMGEYRKMVKDAMAEFKASKESA